MASTKGFIIDAPNALVISENKTYSMITAASGQIQVQGSTLEIKGGWSLFDLISIPTGTTLTATLTDAQIDGDMISMVMGSDRSDAEEENWQFGEKYVVPEGGVVSLPHKITAGSLRVEGYEVAEEVTKTGQVKVGEAESKTTLTFHTSDVGAEVAPVYSVSESGEVYNILNGSLPKRGQVILKFPVYTGDNADSGIESICQITIYSASIVQNFTIGGSYKTASTFNLEVKGLDSKRADKRMWNITFFPYTGE